MSVDKGFGQHYDEQSFLQKLARHPALGFLEDAVALWFCLRDPETPAWAKALIVAALGYFICPLDLVPDAIPVAGWADDASVIAAAAAAISGFITDEHRAAARAFLGR
ncbi:MAG TPA: YkvA family protein [Plasticicumulans sp.]|uniref:YkvA family protein n=1 Tax=Plasticicumulans sp. TaxID=2307179 RepID=UPI002C28C147|nr:YkvA family protein [Plasticicumulans sp.]HMW42670.1 YkvA family protein [Plasticicumulans sp.]HMZ10916.1 YkvA family protein [Plasticicumulans sp.]